MKIPTFQKSLLFEWEAKTGFGLHGNHQFLLEVKLMNDLLLDAMPEKPRLFNQIETLKKEATSLVDNAIRRTISSHAEMAESLKKEATFPVENAIALFKQGQISSRMAAKWLNMPRVTFLMLAMEAGAELLDNTPEDFERETALL